MILAIRSDTNEAYIALVDGSSVAVDNAWPAGRELSNQLLHELELLLSTAGTVRDDIHGIIVFQGPGSFTGLRIGISVANALAYGLQVPVIGATGDTWLDDGVTAMQAAKPGVYVAPEYGRDAHITQPRK